MAIEVSDKNRPGATVQNVAFYSAVWEWVPPNVWERIAD